QVEPAKALACGCDCDLELPAACGIKARALEVGGHRGPHPADQRQKAAGQEVERRRKWIVGSSLQREGARPTSHQQSRQHRLKNEGRAAGRAYSERMVAWQDRLRNEGQLGRADRCASYFRATYRRRGIHRSQVLPEQTRLLAPRANLDNAEGLAGYKRKPERSA